MSDLPLDPIAIDVGTLVQKTVTSLYSSLVTRPTGRAVRMAIETQLQGTGARSLSLIDLSEVTIMDFSCADEVVAKLLQRYHESPAHEAFFVFRGVHEPHRDQIDVVLKRQGLAAVAETSPGGFELLGDRTDPEDRAWRTLEGLGLVTTEQSGELFGSKEDQAGFELLIQRHVAFRSPVSGRVHALSRLVGHLL